MACIDPISILTILSNIYVSKTILKQNLSIPFEGASLSASIERKIIFDPSEENLKQQQVSRLAQKGIQKKRPNNKKRLSTFCVCILANCLIFFCFIFLGKLLTKNHSTEFKQV